MFAHSLHYRTVLYDPYIGPDLVLPLRDKVDQGAMIIKGYFTFPRTPRLEPIIRWLSVVSGHSLEESNSSVEIQSVHSITSADWAVEKIDKNKKENYEQK